MKIRFHENFLLAIRYFSTATSDSECYIVKLRITPIQYIFIHGYTVFDTAQYRDLDLYTVLTCVYTFHEDIKGIFTSELQLVAVLHELRTKTTV